MTLSELCKKLNKLEARHGQKPVQVLLVESGIPLALNIEDVEVAQPYDGKRIWLHLGDIVAPDWAKYFVEKISL